MLTLIARLYTKSIALARSAWAAVHLRTERWMTLAYATAISFIGVDAMLVMLDSASGNPAAIPWLVVGIALLGVIVARRRRRRSR